MGSKQERKMVEREIIKENEKRKNEGRNEIITQQKRNEGRKETEEKKKMRSK